eukprot:jgi/Mesvir1/5466/Mv15520-RA.1
MSSLKPSQHATLDQVVAIRGAGAKILEPLPLLERVRLRRTCHAFLSAVDGTLEDIRELFWEDIADAVSKEGGLEWLLRKCPHIQILSVRWRALHERPLVETWEALVMGCATVLPDFARQSLLGLGQCVQLRSLNLSCFGSMVDDKVLAVLAASCGQLGALDVTNCDVTDEGIRAVVGQCKQLEHLTICSTRVTKAAVLAIASECPRLQSLNARISAPPGDNSVDDAAIVLLAERCPKLRHLTLSSPGVSDVGISAIARHCPQLRHLDILGCFEVTDASLQLVGEHCRQLEVLRIYSPRHGRLTAASLRVVAENCPRLRHLSTLDDNIGEEALRCVAKNCSHLEHLGIEGANYGMDAGVAAMSRNCTRLRSFKARNCPLLSDANVATLLSGPAATQLVHLDLSFCRNITDEALFAVGRSCPELRLLSLSSCGYVSDAGVMAVARGCRKLVFADVVGCGVTSGGLRLLDRSRCRVYDNKAFWEDTIGGYCET